MENQDCSRQDAVGQKARCIYRPVSRYARNSVSLEHVHMVNRGTDSGYLEVAKLELRARKITNRMDEIIAVMMWTMPTDNRYSSKHTPHPP